MLKSYFSSETELFIKNHLGEPEIDTADWVLEIDGLVEKGRSFMLSELRRLPQTHIVAFHKCAGSPVDPNKPTPHEVGNVVWSGVPLKHLLELCLPKRSATHVWMAGADFGSYRGADPQHYAKDLLLSKAMSNEVIIAIAMNHAPLTTTRGGPVRLVVPGYYATNSVKWLTSIKLQAKRSTSIFTTKYYNDTLSTTQRLEHLVPVWGVKPDSVIVGVSNQGVLTGWCWGEAEINTVDVSLDSGQSWLSSVVSKREQHSWQKFSISLPELKAGSYAVIARATDGTGEHQPFSGTRNSMVPFEFRIPNG